MTAAPASGSRRLRGHGREVLSLALCLVAVGGFAWAKGLVEDQQLVGTDRVAVGQTFDMRELTVTVTDVTLSHAIKDETEEVHQARGVFVLVTWAGESRNHTTALSQKSIVLRTTDGRTYSPTASSVLPASNPGFVDTSVMVYDVPMDRVEGSAIVIPAPNAMLYGYDRELEVDLGLPERPTVTQSVPDPRETPPKLAGR